MDCCYECEKPINGFAYGFGYNKMCSTCHEKEIIQRESRDIQREMLKVEKQKLRILQKGGIF